MTKYVPFLGENMTRYAIVWMPDNKDYQWMVWDDYEKRFISYHTCQEDASKICRALNVR